MVSPKTRPILPKFLKWHYYLWLNSMTTNASMIITYTEIGQPHFPHQWMSFNRLFAYTSKHFSFISNNLANRWKSLQTPSPSVNNKHKWPHKKIKLSMIKLQLIPIYEWEPGPFHWWNLIDLAIISSGLINIMVKISYLII